MNLVSEFKIKEANGELLPEPLLVEDKSRFVLFPIKHTDVSESPFLLDLHSLVVMLRACDAFLVVLFPMKHTDVSESPFIVDVHSLVASC